MLRQRALVAGVMGGGDSTAPTVTITSSESSPTAASPIPVTFTFSEVVTGFAVGDITVGGGTAGNFAGSGAVYTADITPTGNAIVTVDVAANVCQDGAGNNNTAATQFKIGIQVTLTYQPDNATGVDNYTDSAGADTAQGGNARIRVTSSRVGLIKFPISLGAGAAIVSGTLSVWADVQVASARTVTVRRILDANANWDEASTWNYKTPSTVRWAGDTGADGGADAGCTVSGTDTSSTAMGSFTYNINDPAGTKYDVTLNATELASMCSSNNGVSLTTPSAADWGIRSCEHATTAEHPKLVVVVNYLP